MMWCIAMINGRKNRAKKYMIRCRGFKYEVNMYSLKLSVKWRLWNINKGKTLDLKKTTKGRTKQQQNIIKKEQEKMNKT
jgi:hypothetical protein